MKEEEAKQRWCPMSKTSMLEECIMGVTTYNYNRLDVGDNVVPNECKCIASDCMMWVEDLTREEASSGFIAKNGHCGLAK